MMKLNITEFKEMLKHIDDINSSELSDIELEGIELCGSFKEEWKLTGLNNVHYIRHIIDHVEHFGEPPKSLFK